MFRSDIGVSEKMVTLHLLFRYGNSPVRHIGELTKGAE